MRLIALVALSILAASAQTMRPGFDPNAIDKKADPCVDFYQYACGNWLAANPIPADQSTWGRFSELNERNQRVLRDILETASFKKERTPVEQKIGDYWESCMDEKGIEAKGITPLKPMFDRIDAIKNKKQLTDEVVRLHRSGVGALFTFSSGQDLKNAQEVIAQADQGGISLPERDYYLKEDPKSVETRKAYVAHLQKMFELLGHSAEQATKEAQTVMSLETAMAKASMDITTRRDPIKTYHRMPISALEELNPAFDWNKYFATIGVPKVKDLNVAVPEFFKGLEQQINTVSLDDWKTYLKWHVLNSAAPFLPKAFVDENFNFFTKTLRGAKEIRPRWKRCVQYTDVDLGEAMGQKYVEVTFGKEGKDKTLEMVHALEKAMERDIKQLDWMTPATKQRALEKLHAITNKIGYPEKWRDYAKYEVRRGDPLGNSFRANEFEFQRSLDKIGKPVDPKEWFMTPPTVNAYYDPQMNNINFPAGILQPPFYEKGMDDPVNYGGIGSVIGHELTHGFDDQGRQFDAKGDLKDWWTEQDAKEFEKRAECIEKQYGEYVAVGDLKQNGKLTLGENVADNGGMRIAYMALMDVLTADKKNQKIDGFTPEQRFFLGFGQIWCTNMTEQAARLRALTDPHSLGKYRVNGTVSNSPEFQKAFACKVGQPMSPVPEKACRVW